MAGYYKRKRYFDPPPRWLHCPRKGSLIIDKFIAFKTPLDGRYESQIPEECIFTPSLLLASLSRMKIKVGLWIDLTNTTRYYDKREVESQNIKYIKLQCQGHGECPSFDQTRTFIQLCQKFISQNPLEVIGVHCTHGFNRTGFLIVAYLVESLSWSVEAAIDCFSQARPPGIYKADYLQELFRRYGDNSNVYPAPPLPEWCNEDNFDDDRTEEMKNTQPPPKKRKEFIKKNPLYMERKPGVEHVTDNRLISKFHQKYQNMHGWKGNRFPGPQSVSMNLNNNQHWQRKPYKSRRKTD